MARFMLLMKGGYEAWQTFTPEEIQQAIQQYRDWANRLREQGKYVDANKLADDGVRTLVCRDGQVAVDGPFAETKETVGGYFIVEAADYDEAIALARDCPILARGSDGSVEVRCIEGT